MKLKNLFVKSERQDQPKRLKGNCSWCGVYGHMARDCWTKAAARRKIVIRTPPEDTGCPSGFALLDKSMYGTKDVTQCFDVTCSTMGDWCRSSCGSLKSHSTWWYSLTETAPENANKKLQEAMNTKNLTEKIFKVLDSITKYNTKQLVDNMNKNTVLHIIFLVHGLRQILVLKQNLIKEKFDVKAEVEER